MNERIIRKIQDLGISLNNKPSIAGSDGSFKELKNKLEKILNGHLPQVYLDFVNEFGDFYFDNLVRVKLQEKNPVADNENAVTVNYFYSPGSIADQNIFNVLEDYAEQLPQGYLPIFDGVAGDFLCLSLRVNDYGKVYYWFHEGSPGNDLFYVAPDFETFIMSLFVSEHIADEAETKAEIKVTPQLLELLRKSGHDFKSR